MSLIPTHKAVQQYDFGIFLKEISPTLPQETIVHAHRDDYYIFGMVNNGDCRINIDFKDYQLSGSKMMCIQPGQIHHVVKSSDLTAFLLFDPSDKHIIAECIIPRSFSAKRNATIRVKTDFRYHRSQNKQS